MEEPLEMIFTEKEWLGQKVGEKDVHGKTKAIAV